MRRLLVSIIEFYQNYLSFDRGVLAIFAPGGACKYSVSCSEYTKGQIEKFGVFRGICSGLKRVWSCR